MKTHATLYKRTSTGAVQVWWMDSRNNEYRSHTGQKDGKIITSEWTQVFGKNAGQANATTDEAQALAEVEAKYRNKLTKGRYHETIDTIDIAAYHVPMKAKKYSERWKPEKMWAKDETYYSQKKYDGVRCVIKHDGLWTFGGKPMGIGMKHIWDDVKFIFVKYPDLILDGEIYNHEYAHLLNRISGMCRKQTLTDEEMEIAQLMQFHMYDVTGKATFDLGSELVVVDETTTWADRMVATQIAYQIIANTNADSWKQDGRKYNSVEHADTELLEDQKQLDDLHYAYVNDNYEGQIIRFGSNVYEHKYSATMLKRKEFDDSEFTIVRFEEGVGNRKGVVSNIVCKTDDGIEFGTGIKNMSVPEATKLFEERDAYVGGQATVQHLGYSEYGVPLIGKTSVVYRGKRDL